MRNFILINILCFLIIPVWASAEAMTTMEFGLRGGGDNGGYNLKEDYVASELYFLKQLPWGTTMGEHATLTSRFDMGATYLEAQSEGGCMMAVGADLVLGLWNGTIELDLGFRPTWMFKDEYGIDDFGGGLQFSSHVGLSIIWQAATFNYRLQHTSNGGIYEPNPGLNLHMLGLGYRF